MKELDSDKSLSSDYRVGIRLKLIQKESPDHLPRRELNKWKQQFPDLFIKLQEYVYKNSSSVDVVDNNN